MYKIKSYLLLLALGAVMGTSGAPPAADCRLTNLRCEMLTNPLGIDARYPRLSWEIGSNERNVKQTAYQVLVASSREKLAAGEADCWNSGRVASDQSIHVKYAGKLLKSGDACYWKVKAWTNKGVAEWSEPASWTMGLLYYKDWPRGWIGFDEPFPGDNITTDSRLSACYFRKEFEAEKKISTATVSIMGLGLYELSINGKKVGDAVLAPAPTDYTKNVKYNTYDVTAYLREGKNAVGVVLGNGRFFAMRQHSKPYKIKTFGFPKLLMALTIRYTDGTTRTIATDESWKGTPDGPIRANNEYDGEEYDARKEMPGWNSPGFDDSGWLRARYVQEPAGAYEAQMNEPIKVMRELPAVSVTKLTGDRFVVDMGQNMVGWVRLRVKESAGSR
mgnify:CR=1 FL=1